MSPLSPKPARTAKLGEVMPKEVPLTGCGVQRAVFRLGSLRIDHCGAACACPFISMDVVVERLTYPRGVSRGLPHP